MKPKLLYIPVWLWMRLILKLRKRGHGLRESGAFLLGRPDENRRVTEFVCYDDLDPTALDTGIIVFHGAGFVPLWDYCHKRQMTVLADIHTHGDKWTGQSNADRTHPMVGQKHHISLIAPYYAARNLLSLNGIGVYEYAGNHEWVTHPSATVKLTLI